MTRRRGVSTEEPQRIAEADEAAGDQINFEKLARSKRTRVDQARVSEQFTSKVQLVL